MRASAATSPEATGSWHITPLEDPWTLEGSHDSFGGRRAGANAHSTVALHTLQEMEGSTDGTSPGRVASAHDAGS